MKLDPNSIANLIVGAAAQAEALEEPLGGARQHYHQLQHQHQTSADCAMLLREVLESPTHLGDFSPGQVAAYVLSGGSESVHSMMSQRIVPVLYHHTALSTHHFKPKGDGTLLGVVRICWEECRHPLPVAELWSLSLTHRQANRVGIGGEGPFQLQAAGGTDPLLVNLGALTIISA